jgi:hypothetical protein
VTGATLAYCYWNWRLLAREQHYRKTSRKGWLSCILTELSRELDAVRANWGDESGDRLKPAPLASCNDPTLAGSIRGLRTAS